ncbi:hypothetical protein BLNAU_13962 [Blattamonas nauphoetae]|uniref:Uncharacterized protein n=1 Tax=Blattamonas nauphoetae TaxID=2049346 RepID=A0ABQ9XI49_9EUKA|nr:hypothetical protein BLNAU_13962 [Blattamonas nauphoetae]
MALPADVAESVSQTRSSFIAASEHQDRYNGKLTSKLRMASGRGWRASAAFVVNWSKTSGKLPIPSAVSGSSSIFGADHSQNTC